MAELPFKKLKCSENGEDFVKSSVKLSVKLPFPPPYLRYDTVFSPVVVDLEFVLDVAYHRLYTSVSASNTSSCLESSLTRFRKFVFFVLWKLITQSTRDRADYLSSFLPLYAGPTVTTRIGAASEHE